jgi:hypothetical protein
MKLREDKRPALEGCRERSLVSGEHEGLRDDATGELKS